MTSEIADLRRFQRRFTQNRVWIKGLYGFIIFVMLLTAKAILAVKIPNPIAANSFPELVLNIAKAIQAIALVLAPVALIIAGFKFITSATAGNATGVADARKMFLWILVGTAIVVGASALAQAVVNFARQL